MFKEDVLQEIKQVQERYKEELDAILDKAGTEKKHKTMSGLLAKPLYTPADIADISYLDDISFPGHYPFTRNAFAAGFLSRSPSIRQVAGFGTAEETNKRWKYLIQHGATALSFVRDDGGGCRADSNDERVKGLVGHGGVALETLYDYETLFDGIDILKYSVHMIACSAFTLAAFLIIAEKRGIDFQELRGSMSNFMRPEPECIDIMEYCARHVPQFNAGYLDMRNVREGGCTATQEIAFGVAIAMAGADALIDRGLEIDDFLHRITWFVNAGPEFFEEVAKFRALRRVWARVFREQYGAKDEKSLMARMHCQTYAPTLTKEEPFNNIIRSTIYALSAFMGGIQSLHVNSFDEALAIPTEFSSLLSVRTQQIIDIETGISKTVDPMGGSYYIEWLTNELEKEVWDLLNVIKSKGGGTEAWEWMCGEVRSAAIKNQNEFDRGERKLVGVHIHAPKNDIQAKALNVLQENADFEGIFEYDPTIIEKQIGRLNKVLKERDEKKLEHSKKNLLNSMKERKNMIPFLVEAVRNGLTHGEFARLKAEAYSQNPHGPYECNPPMVLA